jgi:hypothetical protein
MDITMYGLSYWQTDSKGLIIVNARAVACGDHLQGGRAGERARTA